MLKLRPCGKMNGGITSPSFVTIPNTMMWTGCLVFINMKSSYWCFRCECQAVQYAISKFLEEQILSWCCFLHKQYPTNCSLLHSRQNLEKLKYMHEMNNSKWQQFTHPTLYTHTHIYQHTCIYNHHHHVMLQVQISLTLSRHFSLSFIVSGRSSGLHPISSHNCCM